VAGAADVAPALTVQRRLVAPVDVHPAVAAVMNSVYADPAVAPKDAAGVAARVLAAVLPVVIEEVAAAAPSPATKLTVLGLEALEAVISIFFPHPALGG
jgi:hypothetical protein